MKRAMPRAPDRSSTGLKASRDFWTDQIAQARPHTAPDQMASVALKMALEELQNRLSAESQTSWILAEPLSPGGARASVIHPPDRERPGYLAKHSPTGSALTGAANGR